MALIAAALLQTVVIIIRTTLKGAPPFQTLYESLAWFAWIDRRRLSRSSSGAGASGSGLLRVARRRRRGVCTRCWGRAPRSSRSSRRFRAAWFFWHVAIAFGSYAIFVVAFAVEISYLLQLLLWKLGVKRDYGLTRENISRFHRSVHQLVLFGFPMLTFGIMSGAAWANEAWGVYWQWDPKETWSLITWFVFALYLHTRVRPTWRGAPSSVIMILAFLCMVTTFVGVSAGWRSSSGFRVCTSTDSGRTP